LNIRETRFYLWLREIKFFKNFLLFSGLQVVIGIILNILFFSIEENELVLVDISSRVTGSPIPLLALLLVLPIFALIEELLFRYLPYIFLKKFKSDHKIIVFAITGTINILAHTANIISGTLLMRVLYLVPITFQGLFFSDYLMKHGLKASFLLHLSWNVVIILLGVGM
jgi:membrane protease YdiL (CAAX protease family)